MNAEGAHVGAPSDHQTGAGLESQGIPPDEWAQMTDRFRGGPLGTPDRSAKVIDGGRFIFDTPETPEIMWGDGSEILWSKGEPCLISAPTGAGKTTLSGQLVRGMLVGGTKVIGYSVAQMNRVLYLACDRPTQIARALRRNLGDLDRDLLGERLVVHSGPLLYALADNPRLILDMAEDAKADVVIIDSLKDVVPNLSKEEGGAAISSAMQHCVANDVQVLASHHHRKATGDNKKPNTINDLYGMVNIPNGCGSVISLYADKPGSEFVEFSQLKPVMETVGPFTVKHDFAAGVTRRASADPLEALRDGGPLDPRQLAEIVFGSAGKNEVQRMRRKLKGLMDTGHVERVPNLAHGGAGGGSTGDLYQVCTYVPEDAR